MLMLGVSPSRRWVVGLGPFGLDRAGPFAWLLCKRLWKGGDGYPPN